MIARTSNPEARILVVDDQETNRLLLSTYLRQAGYRHITLAADGLEALEQVARVAPDLVLLDLVMPGMEGFEVCQRLRAEGHRDLPVIVQTALNRSDDRRRAFAAGATDFIVKPIHPQELLARVHVHLARRMRLRELTDYRTRRAMELALARRVHERVLPGTTEVLLAEGATGLMVQSFFEPSQELGGDFWDLRADGRGRLVVWIVDFSGHGITAAIHALRLQGELRRQPAEGLDPAAHLEEVNATLKRLLPTGSFATILVAVLDAAAGTMTYASAGAPRPLMLDAEGTFCFLEAGGLPAGILGKARYENRTVPFPPGATLLLASDGFTEAEGPDGMLEEDGLAAAAGAARGGHGLRLDRMVAALREKVRFADDLSAVSVTRP